MQSAEQAPARPTEHWTDVFVRMTNQQPDRVYARHGARQITYGELRRHVDSMASGLLDRGVRPTDVVALWMTNSIDFVVAQWAAYRLGCVLLPLYSYYREYELVHALGESRATVLLTSADFAGKVNARAILHEFLPELDAPVPAVFARLPHLRLVCAAADLGLPGVVAFDGLGGGSPVHGGALDAIADRLSPLDPMNVMYTSGTTGTPKAGISMHCNNLSSVRSWLGIQQLGPADVILCHVPMFTNFGCLYANCLAMYAGSSMEITATFDAAESLRLIRESGVTYVPGSPEIFRMLLEHPDAAITSFAAVRGAHIAGSAADPAVLARVIELIPNASQAYGMSECGGVSTATHGGDPEDLRRLSVGLPLPSVRVVIMDPITEGPVTPGEIGEIWFGDVSPGSCVGKGYLASPSASAAAITPDGWFRSGDLGRVDEAGYVYFSGRLKNMITVGGFNVYPAEVERHLMAHDDVATASVVGAPDERLGTVPVAFVVLRDGAVTTPADLIGYMKARVSSQKQPRLIEILDAAEVPMTPSGKIATAKLELRAESSLAARAVTPR